MESQTELPRGEWTRVCPNGMEDVMLGFLYDVTLELKLPTLGVTATLPKARWPGQDMRDKAVTCHLLLAACYLTAFCLP